MSTSSPAPHGRILTIFAPKGGCGKTTLATNAAVVLNADGARTVCLVDLDFAFGDVASTLGIEPAGSLADAVALRGQLDPEVVLSLVTPIAPGLDSVLAPARPGASAAVPAALVGELLAILPAMYDYIVVDTPPQFSAHVLMALDSSHHHVLITTPERPALHNLRLTLDLLDLLSYSRTSRSVVLNRCDSRVGITVADVESAISTAVAGELPSSWDVPASVNRGVPLAAAQPRHRYSQAVNRFIHKLTATPDPLPPIPGSPDLDESRWQW